jgi:hypothetical protein
MEILKMKAKLDKKKFPETFRVLEINNTRCGITNKSQVDFIIEKLNSSGERYSPLNYSIQ